MELCEYRRVEVLLWESSYLDSSRWSERKNAAANADRGHSRPELGCLTPQLPTALCR